ncbi:hypothetical protein VCHA53O466_140199 [Vibrio chagasii]|nr:hypothetical protein VCHA53O466_140199 [Vibrio chagasii]
MESIKVSDMPSEVSSYFRGNDYIDFSDLQKIVRDNAFEIYARMNVADVDPDYVFDMGASFPDYSGFINLYVTQGDMDGDEVYRLHLMYKNLAPELLNTENFEGWYDDSELMMLRAAQLVACHVKLVGLLMKEACGVAIAVTG